jgi:hypothetical protein
MASVSSGSNGSICAFPKPGEAYRSYVFFAYAMTSPKEVMDYVQGILEGCQHTSVSAEVGTSNNVD